MFLETKLSSILIEKLGNMKDVKQNSGENNAKTK